MKDGTQNDRILKALKAAGQRGMTSLELSRLHPPILKYTNRLSELRRAGYYIGAAAEEGEHGAVWRYTYQGQAPGAPLPAPAEVAKPDGEPRRMPLERTEKPAEGPVARLGHSGTSAPQNAPAGQGGKVIKNDTNAEPDLPGQLTFA